MIKAVIFDMDGLIIDSEPINFQAYNEVLKSLGFSLDFKDYIKYFGTSNEYISKDLIKKFKIKKTLCFTTH